MARLNKAQAQTLQRQIKHLDRVDDQLHRLHADLVISGRPRRECDQVGAQIISLRRIITELQGVGERLGPEV